MKRIAIIIVLCLLEKILVSQSYSVKATEIFEDNIGKPVLYMRDGTTVFQYYSTKKNAMLITIIDKNQSAIVTNKVVEFKKVNFNYYFNPKHSFRFRKWADSNGKILIYITCDGESYRMTMNSTTGNIENEEIIDEKSIPISRDDNNIDKTTGNSFSYEKSAWKVLNGKEAEARTDFSDISIMTITISGPDGKQLQKFPFDYVNKKYQSADILAYTFDNNSLYLVSRQFKMHDRSSYDRVKYYNSNLGSNAEGAICFSKYDLKTQKFSHIELFDLKPEMYFENCKLLFNDRSSMIDLRFIVKTGAKGASLGKDGQVFYEIFFLPIDVNAMKSGKPFYLPSEKLDSFVKENCKIAEGYRGGMLDKCMLDKTGNLFTTKVKNVTSYSDFSSGYIYTQNPEIIGISYFDMNGKEIYGVAYPYNSNGTANPNSFSFEVSKNDFTYMVATGSESNFIFLNNLEKNFNLPPDQKPEYAKSLDDCHAIALEIKGDGTIKQSYIFGNPVAKKNKYVDFSNAMYDKNSNTYIVKFYDGPGYKNARVAWIKIN